MSKTQEKICTGCKVLKPASDFYPRKIGRLGLSSRCRACLKVRDQNYYEKHRAWHADYYRKNAEKIKAYSRQRHLRYKLDALNAYGGKCACCGETHQAFLAIDHPDNDGNKHRREIRKKGGDDFYIWLKRNNYPPNFQVLCHNCNFGKHINKGVCPHHSP